MPYAITDCTSRFICPIPHLPSRSSCYDTMHTAPASCSHPRTVSCHPYAHARDRRDVLQSPCLLPDNARIMDSLPGISASPWSICGCIHVAQLCLAPAHTSLPRPADAEHSSDPLSAQDTLVYYMASYFYPASLTMLVSQHGDHLSFVAPQLTQNNSSFSSIHHKCSHGSGLTFRLHIS